MKSNIQVLVDVRSTPYSRFAQQFNRESLRRSLFEVGIQYRFEGDRLGGRPFQPDFFKARKLPESAERHDYLKIVDYEAVMESTTFKESLAQLLETASTARVAIMCSEEDPSKCHREQLIAAALAKSDEPVCSVLHIRKSGEVEPSTIATQLALF